MSTIERKITLDGFKSHYHSFIPYIGIEYDGMGRPVFPEHGNWGKYPYDIDLCKCTEYSDLKVYFGYNENAETARVSFLQLVEKYRLMNKIICNTQYQKKITKNGEEKIFSYSPFLREKYGIEILSVEYDEDGIIIGPTEIPYTIWGLYPDNSFNENGGLKMLNFLLRVLGFFIVDVKYIGDNYVPDIMCYTEIETYRRRMQRIRNSSECCIQDEYEKYGGEDFYVYLGGKQQMIQSEIDYWSKKLYITNNEPTSPELFLSVSLNSDFHNIGIYSVLNDSELGEVNHEKIKCTNVENSKLIFLRHSKISYCERNVDGNMKEEELPFILLEDEERGILVAKTPYIVGYAKNIRLEFDVFYGDLISSITPVDREDADLITYVMGAEIMYDYEQQIWVIVDETVGVKYTEKVPYKIHDYTKEEDLYYTLIDNGIEVNAFKNPTMIEGIDRVKIYEIDANAEVTSEFWVYNNEEMTYNQIIMEDYNFGKIETLVENAAEINIDRGYISAFELLYKMGEINTMDDIVNYSNNIFGI